MTDELEAAILDLACDRGLLKATDLAEVAAVQATPTGQAGPSSRIERLVDLGRLSREAVAALEDEVRRTRVGEHGRDPERTVVTASGEHTQVSAPPTSDSLAALAARDRDYPPDWDRFTDIRLLGEGGMGRVYRAVDPRLNRAVALKFLRGQDPSMVDRFLNEARSQARVEHENVCQIHEVGEVGGRPFIAMQLISGTTLGAAARTLPLDDVIAVMAKVCRAVHAAHRQGLVHRDIKPANIMVERTDEGLLKPYVLDFGLAREEAAHGATATGFILGTPGFMAPEQARGETRTIGARTDVWALGATLYDVLTGRPPFEGSMLEVLVKIGTEEVTPPRRLRPDLPADLEVVLLKCLENDAALRYPSALELAEELERVLAGEPVLAQPPSLSRIVRRRLRRNRLGVAVGAVALAAVLIGGATVATVAWRARRAAERSHAITQEIPRLEEMVRLAYSRPLHDVRGELNEVRRRLDELAAEAMRDAADVGAVRYALGRGYLALDDAETAQKHLEAAWQEGNRAPEVAYALGLANVQLYREQLEMAGRLGDRDLVKKRRAELETTYLQPALEYLELGRKAEVEAPELVEALVAAVRRNWSAALDAAAAARQRIPWLVAADRLTGEVDLAHGEELYTSGQYDQAAEVLAGAREAYERALQTAPSDPRAAVGLCRQANDLILLANETGKPSEEPYHRAINACGRALTADPESSSARHALALAHLRWAGGELRRGGDPSAALEQAMALSNVLLAENPDDAAALTHLGIATRWSAQLAAARGEDPRPGLKQATDVLARAVDAEPGSYLALNNLGLAWFFWGLTDYDEGRDPRPAATHAVDAFQRMLTVRPDQAAAMDNMGVALWLVARHAALWGDDPRPDLERAVTVLERAVKLNPKDTVALANLGLVHAERAAFSVLVGEDPNDDLASATDWCAQVRAVNPSDPFAAANLAQVHRIAAAWALDRGASPVDEVRAARKTAREAADLNPSDAEPWLILGEAETVLGRWQAGSRRDPVSAYRGAQTALEHAITLNPRSVDARCAAARLQFWWGSHVLATGGRAAEHLSLGTAALDQLEGGTDRADALAARGLLELLSARAATGGKRAEAARSATQAFEQALTRNRWLDRELSGQLAAARSLAGTD